MKTISTIAGITTIALLCLPGFSYGQAEEAQSVEDVAVKKEIVELQYRNIQDDIDPSFVWLSNIGAMIDEARRYKDGDGLIASALLLMYAEKAAGKQSDIITGEDLLNEASALVHEQKNAALAARLSGIWGDSVLGPGDKNRSAEFAKLADDYEKATLTTRGYGYVIVENLTGYFVDVYIDGYYRGTLYPIDYAYYRVWEGLTLLYAEASHYYYYWGPRRFDLSEHEEFTWTLNPVEE